MDRLTPDMLLYGIVPMIVFVVLAVLVWEWRGEIAAVFGRYVVYRPTRQAPETPAESAENADESAATTTPATRNNGIAITQTERNELLVSAKAQALAAMVHAGKVGETEGIKIVFGISPSSSNPRYKAARDALKTELANLQPSRFTPLDEERKPLATPKI